MLTEAEQVILLNKVSYITRLGCVGKKPISPSKALKMLENLGVTK